MNLGCSVTELGLGSRALHLQIMETTMKNVRILGGSLVASIALFGSASAFATNNSATSIDAANVKHVSKAFTQGDAGISFRARAEGVSDKASTLRKGDAYTLQTRLHYNTAYWNDAAAAVDFISVGSYMSDRHNSDSLLTPRTSTRPVIEDPKGDSVHQAYVVLKALPDTNVVVGRQEIDLDNGRFVGTEHHRQTPNSFDAISVTNTTYKDWEFFYAYVDSLNTYYSGTHAVPSASHPRTREQRTHLVNATWEGMKEYATISAFGLMVEDRDAVTNSGDTYGVYAWGDRDIRPGYNLGYKAGYASFETGHKNTANYDANWWTLGASLSFDRLGPLEKMRLCAGYEAFEGVNGQGTFKAPFSEKHSFNGIVDAVDTFANGGLVDWSLRLAGSFRDVDMYVAAHKFEAENKGAITTNQNYGSEYDAGAIYKFHDRYSVGVEVGSFSSRNNSGYQDKRIALVTATADFM